MHSQKTLERRAFLASTAASVAASVAGCREDSNGGGTMTEPTHTGSNSTAPVTGGTTTTGANPTTTSLSAAVTSPASQTSSSQPESNSSANMMSSSETSQVSETLSAVDSTIVEVPADDACFESGGTDGGMGQDAGGGGLCSTNTDNGDHCHPLAVPQSDVDAGFAEATYNLEDGGTGHTHTVTLTAYDVFYLQAGIARELESTTDSGHSHVCVITCSV